MTTPDLLTITKTLRASGVAHADALAAHATPSLRLLANRVDGRVPMGVTRLGGAPDVPLGFVWPTSHGAPLTFLAQLDLATLAAPDLPATGWLLFFYDAVTQPWGFDADDAGGAQVIYVDEPLGSLTRCPHPPIDPDDEAGPFALCDVEIEPTIDLADAEDSLVTTEIPEAQRDAYDDISGELAGLDEGDVYHHVLGHPQLLQTDMRCECQLVVNGIAIDDERVYRTPRVRALLAAAPTTWRLLLQLDTDPDGPGWR